HPGLRHRRLRHRRGGDAAWAYRPQGGSGAGWRFPAAGMARGRPCLDDRSRRHAIYRRTRSGQVFMTVDVITFGCRLNAYESEAIKLRVREAQLRDAVVVNTCAVTAEAVRQSRQAIRKLRRERPGARIIVTGCAAQTEPDTYAAMAEVDAVLGNAEKLTA